MKTKCFCYLRVSGLTQLQGDGMDRQLIACQEYADKNDLYIAEIFKENGISGTKDMDNRPALAEMLVALEENGVKIAICEKLDRIARDLLLQETIVGDMQRRGFTLVSTMEPDLCSSDPSRILVRQIFGAIAQYDRAILTSKMNAAKQRMRAKGLRVEGRHPFGTKPGESAILARMRELRTSGLIYADIAAALTAEGHASRMGGAWTTGAVAKILARRRTSMKSSSVKKSENNAGMRPEGCNSFVTAVTPTPTGGWFTGSTQVFRSNATTAVGTVAGGTLATLAKDR